MEEIMEARESGWFIRSAERKKKKTQPTKNFVSTKSITQKIEEKIKKSQINNNWESSLTTDLLCKKY